MSRGVALDIVAFAVPGDGERAEYRFALIAALVSHGLLSESYIGDVPSAAPDGVPLTWVRRAITEISTR